MNDTCSCVEGLMDNQTMFDMSTMNQKIEEILIKNNLKETNEFFIAAQSFKTITPLSAFKIASNWVEITKTFMFTVIQGLGTLAENLLDQSPLNDNQLLVLQTAFSVISDDLNNINSVFNKLAPTGVDGIHYKWWESCILAKLRPIVNAHNSLTDETRNLLSKMREFGNEIFGAPIQLRIVEVIALDICLAFDAIFSSVKNQGLPIFEDPKDKIWITSHIVAEASHGQEVSNCWSGMAKIAQTKADQERMLKLSDDYAHVWSKALNALAHLL